MGGVIPAGHDELVLLASSKINWSESGLVVRQWDQRPAAVPFLVADLSVGSICQINVPDCVRAMEVAMLSKVDCAFPDS